MSRNINIKKGLDINIKGAASISQHKSVKSDICAIVPDDFPGFTPKPSVKEGDHISVGGEILHDKRFDDIKITSPVSGIVKAIVRGNRRKIERIEIAVQGNDDKIKFQLNDKSREELKRIIMHSGLWVMLRQRPYDIIPTPDKTPRDIFVTGFDSAPLAPDFNFILKDKETEIKAGLEALSILTDGNVYIGLRTEKNLCNAQNVRPIVVSGPHPAGNAGIQAANISPVNKGEIIWTTDLITVSRIGELLLTGTIPTETTIALTGSEIAEPKYITAPIGAKIGSIIAGDIIESPHHKRIISGNVLTGIKVEPDGFLRYPYRQITVIPEGDDVDEFMGWASLSPNKMSVNRSFIGHFLKSKLFSPDARLLGGRRAMIMSGEYDKVLPMDILAEYLIKAIISRNIDDMEKLGIYEIAPEDMALCEYVDTSKLEIQKIVREGLDYLRAELE